MKKLFVFILLFMFLGSALAQESTVINWGKRFEWGTTFSDSDSMYVMASTLNDTLFGADTLYTEAMLMPGDGQVGIYEFAAYLDSLSGTSASISIDVRFGYTFYSRNYKNVKWTGWNNIYSAKKDTLYRLYIAPSDSTWFQPANVRQYRAAEADADSVILNVTDFLR